MSLAIRRLRSLLIALAVLALSATAVFAGRSVLSAPQPHVVSQHEDGDEAETGAPETDTGDTDEVETDTGDTDEVETDEVETDDAPDADTEKADVPKADNHGTLVSEAAKAPTPEGFDNHGAYVRTIGQDNHGHATDATRKTKSAKKH